MMIRVKGFSGSAGLIMVPPKELENGKYYATGNIMQNDEGEEYGVFGVVYVTIEQVPGETKAVKLIKAVDSPKQKRLSELPGMKFFGPLTFGFFNEPAAKNTEGDK